MCNDPINRSGGTEHRNLPSPGRLTVYTEVIHVDVKPASRRSPGRAQTKIIATMLQFQKSPAFCIA
jgi:hypothetical protein